MAVLRNTGLIEAPLATVGAALRHTRTAETGLAALGVRGEALTGAGSLLVPGDELAFRLAGFTLTTRIVRADADRLSSVLVGGPLRRLEHDTVLAQVGPRTLLTDSVRWTTPLGVLGRFGDVAVGRKLVLDVLAARVRAVRELAESWASRTIVVGTALVHEGRLLAQQRSYPAAHAGRWELPGGRVEAGEDEADAVVRECREELDVDVRPTGRLGTDVPLDNGMLLRIHTAELKDPGQVPRAVEHREVRWLTAADLPTLDWLETDRVLLHDLRALLR
ncbi:NUDIX domain-containing protein [Saccharopolyspora sp. TS4A08]|uniref:8-oxo-dGTP diphosphatase n=1 Tax=Saccharopolyspora ipomoeae TaxID=3042027 RepID=A0ABT6PX13_9PSEU|nr:NUDIX domain-containing protein [Saccharopolyspora sp. TS4A08]MDI2032559.1 NUDIX domain-containing protein [Saccharopolyspora sp. TS4A08]